MEVGKQVQGWGTGPQCPPGSTHCWVSLGKSASAWDGVKAGVGLTGGVEGRGGAVGPTVLHGKHLHKFLLEDGQQVGDAVIQADIENKLQKERTV